MKLKSILLSVILLVSGVCFASNYEVAVSYDNTIFSVELGDNYFINDNIIVEPIVGFNVIFDEDLYTAFDFGANTLILSQNNTFVMFGATTLININSNYSIYGNCFKLGIGKLFDSVKVQTSVNQYLLQLQNDEIDDWKYPTAISISIGCIF